MSSAGKAVSAASYQPTDLQRRALHAATSIGIDVDFDCRVEPLGDDTDNVMRIHCRGERPPTVIAKLATRQRVAFEESVYETILRRLPVRTPLLYGAAVDGDAGWLVLEDVGDWQPDWNDPEFIRRRSSWLLRVHLEAPSLIVPRALPDRGPAHFWIRLQENRSRLNARINAAADLKDRDVLAGALRACDATANRWHAVTTICAPVSGTLVHGDLAAQNMRFLRVGDHHVLIVLDWEKAGWGPPAVDLAQIDIGAYCSDPEFNCLHRSPEEIEALARVGRIFRVLVHDFASKSRSQLKRYTAKLWAAIEEAM